MALPKITRADFNKWLNLHYANKPFLLFPSFISGLKKLLSALPDDQTPLTPQQLFKVIKLYFKNLPLIKAANRYVFMPFLIKLQEPVPHAEARDACETLLTLLKYLHEQRGLTLEIFMGCFEPLHSHYKVVEEKETKDILARYKELIDAKVMVINKLGYYFRDDSLLLASLRHPDPIGLSKVITTFRQELAYSWNDFLIDYLKVIVRHPDLLALDDLIQNYFCSSYHSLPGSGYLPPLQLISHRQPQELRDAYELLSKTTKFKKHFIPGELFVTVAGYIRDVLGREEVIFEEVGNHPHPFAFAKILYLIVTSAPNALNEQMYQTIMKNKNTIRLARAIEWLADHQQLNAGNLLTVLDMPSTANVHALIQPFLFDTLMTSYQLLPVEEKEEVPEDVVSKSHPYPMGLSGPLLKPSPLSRISFFGESSTQDSTKWMKRKSVLLNKLADAAEPLPRFVYAALLWQLTFYLHPADVELLIQNTHRITRALVDVWQFAETEQRQTQRNVIVIPTNEPDSLDDDEKQIVEVVPSVNPRTQEMQETTREILFSIAVKLRDLTENRLLPLKWVNTLFAAFYFPVAFMLCGDFTQLRPTSWRGRSNFDSFGLQFIEGRMLHSIFSKPSADEIALRQALLQENTSQEQSPARDRLKELCLTTKPSNY